MKKLGLLALILAIPVATNAASVGCISSTSNLTVGSSVNITFTSNPYSSDVYWNGVLNYDSSKLRLVSGSTKPFIEGQQKANYTFKAIAGGSAYVKISDLTMSVGDNTALENSSSSSCSINISEPSAGGTSSSQNNGSSDNQNKSSNNKLSSLSIEGVSLTPKFSKDTLTYSASVDNDKTSVVISATKDDSSATLSGTGTKELVEGTNKFNVVVTAANGSSRTYSILITRKEADPIKVKVGKKEYTVVTKLPEEFEIPDGFKEDTTKIEGKDALALKNEEGNLVLVLLRSEDGEEKLFVYDENKLTFIPFNLIENKSLLLIALDCEKTKKGYKLEEMKISGSKVKVLVNESNEDFILVYALNLSNGKKDYYIYNKETESLILFDRDIYMPFEKNKKDTKLSLMTALKRSGGIPVFAALGAAAGIFFISSIALLVKNKKLKKRAFTGPKIDDVHSDVDDEKNLYEGDTLTEIDQQELTKKYEDFLNEKKDNVQKINDTDTFTGLFSSKDIDNSGTYDDLSKIIDEGNEEMIDDALSTTQIRIERLKKGRRSK